MLPSFPPPPPSNSHVARARCDWLGPRGKKHKHTRRPLTPNCPLPVSHCLPCPVPSTLDPPSRMQSACVFYGRSQSAWLSILCYARSSSLVFPTRTRRLLYASVPGSLTSSFRVRDLTHVCSRCRDTDSLGAISLASLSVLPLQKPIASQVCSRDLQPFGILVPTHTSPPSVSVSLFLSGRPGLTRSIPTPPLFSKYTLGSSSPAYITPPPLGTRASASVLCLSRM
jgi:hypothetical protein